MSLAARRRAARLFRQAQQASAAGDQSQASRLLAAARRLAPGFRHLELHAALVAARAGQPVAALRTLDDAGRDDPVGRLFRGFFAARAGRLDEALTALDEVLAQQPHNRVAATAKAYALLRAGRPAQALELLRAGPSDNHEVLAWAWLELERLAQSLPLAPPRTPPAPELPRPASRRASARLVRAGVAAAQGNTNCVVRRRWLNAARGDRPPLPATLLRPLLEALERRWPTDPLAAFLAARSTGGEAADLAFHLGAQLCEAGYAAAALPELDAACAAMADSPEAYLPQLYRAVCLTDLRRFDEAAAALAAVAEADALDADESAGSTHEFGQPYWHAIRARVRLARGQSAGAVADLQKALAGEPAMFEQRFAVLLGDLPETWPPDPAPGAGSRRG